jgi:Protein of unknown function (DUF3365)
MKIAQKFFTVMLFSISCFAVGGYIVAREIYNQQLYEQARNTANYVNNVGDWATQYQQIFVSDEGKSTHLTARAFLEFQSAFKDRPATTDELGRVVSIYGKNPALVQRELSDIVSKSENPVKFRLTSQNFMNPSNKPKGWEVNALNKVRTGKVTEFGEIRDQAYNYAKPIYMAASCIRCHGDPAKAPKGVTDLYGFKNGFGFKEGDLSGVIAVTIPYEFNVMSLGRLNKIWSYVALVLFLISVVVPMVYVFVGIIQPIRAQTSRIEDLSIGNFRSEEMDIRNPTSENELIKLHNAVARLGKSLMISMKMLKQSRENERRDDIK